MKTRDEVINECIQRKASVDETQCLLERLGYTPLYPRDFDDAKALYLLYHPGVNQRFFQKSEQE